MSRLPYAPEPGGLRLSVRVVPNARRDAVEGVADDADGPVLRVRLAAPPAEGAANRALVALLAKSLGLRRADVTLRAGEGSRRKRLHLAGNTETLSARLAALSAARP